MDLNIKKYMDTLQTEFIEYKKMRIFSIDFVRYVHSIGNINVDRLMAFFAMCDELWVERGHSRLITTMFSVVCRRCRYILLNVHLKHKEESPSNSWEIERLHVAELIEINKVEDYPTRFTDFFWKIFDDGGISNGNSSIPVDDWVEEFTDMTSLMEWEKPTVTEDWSFIRIFKEAYPPGWRKLFTLTQVLFSAEKNDRVIREKSKGLYVPLKCDILKAYELTPLSTIKVVIVGQDPYHTVVDGVPQAFGLSFASRKGTKTQPSLGVIYSELAKTIPGWENPGHGDLTHWARQGVFMLNTCLTTKPGEAHAHKNIWKSVIDETIELIKTKRPRTMFVLWGIHAQKLCKQLGNMKYITGTHPSPLSSNRGGFIGGDYFNKINCHLVENGMTPIDWKLEP
jgi:uracil-DNA glycosylase